MMLLYINNMRKIMLLATSLTVLLVPVAWAGTPTRASVSVKDFSYSPASVTIKKGGTVTWVWRGRISHNVYGTKASYGINSGFRSSGSWAKRFTRSGSFHYYCTIHPSMKGVVTVR